MSDAPGENKAIERLKKKNLMFILHDGKDLWSAVALSSVGKAAELEGIQAIAAAGEDQIIGRTECRCNQKRRDPLKFPCFHYLLNKPPKQKCESRRNQSQSVESFKDYFHQHCRPKVQVCSRYLRPFLSTKIYQDQMQPCVSYNQRIRFSSVLTSFLKAARSMLYLIMGINILVLPIRLFDSEVES